MNIQKRVHKRVFYGSFLGMGFLIGIIFGISIMTFITGSQLEKLYKANQYLNSTIEEQKNKLEKLQEAINKNQYVLTDIEVTLINLENEFEIITVEKAIKDKYKYLLGRPVNEIDINLVTEVVDKRIFQTELRQYKLKVEKVALSEKLRLWILIEEIV